ncbi:hypothetical protein JXA63_04675 [Candidatus Woesebacteria bacterium]|nr:hypothetical protein [Candidatus Woesebacteria bacterium]
MNIEGRMDFLDFIGNKVCDLSMPQMPRYTIGIYGGLLTTFPRETTLEGVHAPKMIDEIATVTIAANEAADIGVSAELRFKEGVNQSQFVPLAQLRNQMFAVLEDRLDIFCNRHPEMKDSIRVGISDFLSLSRNRGAMDPIRFLELDSGIIEAIFIQGAYTESLLKKAGMDFPGEICETTDELLEKYSIFDLSREEPRNVIANDLRALHACQMAMKVDDDLDGGRFDAIMSLPSFYLLAQESSRDSGKEVDEIMEDYKDHYLEIAGCNPAIRILDKGAVCVHKLSARVKNTMSLGDIEPSDDLWQLSGLVRRLFKKRNSKLRHQLGKSQLLEEAFRTRMTL